MNKILAGDFLILAESPDPDTVYTGSPCLAELPSGRLIASYEWFRQQPLVEKIPDQLEILVSDDGEAGGARRRRWTSSGRRCLRWTKRSTALETAA